MQVKEHIGTVTKKGQVTIPLPVRQLLGIRPYDRVTFRVTAGRVELLPSRISLEAAYGAVQPRAQPEDWEHVRAQAREERIRRRTSKPRTRRTGAR